MTHQQENRIMSRTEINIRRLLTRCEVMAKEDLHRDYRLEHYILAVDDFLKELQNQDNKPPSDVMSEYNKRTDFLKRIVETARIPEPIERAAAAQTLPTGSTLLLENTGPSITTQIHQKIKARYSKDVRAELFGSNGDMDQDGLRQRSSNQSGQDEDLDAIIKYNRNVQEKIAENMLLMTKSMREHALTASAIIKNDLSSLEKSDKLTDQNQDKLKKESLKLEDHTKSTWRCWALVLIVVVMTVFFNMIVFIKIAKKT